MRSDAALAKAVAEKVIITDTLLNQGYYSAAADLSHNDAEMALKPFEGKTTKGKTYAGAFVLPHQGDSDPDKTLSGFKAQLEACKAKTTKLPAIFQFLMNTPGEASPAYKAKSTSGHDTVLVLTIHADKSITITNIDSLLNEGAGFAAWTGVNANRIANVVKSVVAGTPFTLAAKGPQQVPSPLGKQADVECIYSAVGLIASKHAPTESEKKVFTDLATRKLAVVKLMANAAFDQYHEIHKDKAPFSRTEVVDETRLEIATDESVTTYKAVAPDMKVGDIIYPPVLKKLAPEKTVGATVEENVDALKGFDEAAKTAVMQAVFAQAQAVAAKNWISAEYPTVTFELAKKKDSTDDITVSDTECKVHLIATFTKKDGAAVKANITLTRTIDPANPGEVVRCCQTKSALVTWPMQCELMANQSMTERQAAAKRSGLPIDTRIALSIEDNSAKTVLAKDFGSSSDAKLTPKEAELVRAYFAAGYTGVYLNSVGVMLHKDGMKAATKMAESTLPAIFSPSPLPTSLVEPPSTVSKKP